MSSETDLTMAADFFPAENLDTRVHEIKAWIQEKGVRDFEQVSLFSDQLDKVSEGGFPSA